LLKSGRRSSVCSNLLLKKSALRRLFLPALPQGRAPTALLYITPYTEDH
jgi:hypothetical protein